MFSPILAMASVSSAETERPEPGYGISDSLPTSPAASSASLATLPTIDWNCSLRATKSVSEFTSTMAPRVPSTTDADEALGGHAAGLLGGLGEATGAQPVDCGFHVAIGLFERLLAVHHPHAGQVAEFLHLLSSNGHFDITFLAVPPWGPRLRGMKLSARPARAQDVQLFGRRAASGVPASARQRPGPALPEPSPERRDRRRGRRPSGRCRRWRPCDTSEQ